MKLEAYGGTVEGSCTSTCAQECMAVYPSTMGRNLSPYKLLYLFSVQSKHYSYQWNDAMVLYGISEEDCVDLGGCTWFADHQCRIMNVEKNKTIHKYLMEG